MTDWQKIKKMWPCLKICPHVQKGLWDTFLFQLSRYPANATRCKIEDEEEDVKYVFLLCYYVIILHYYINVPSRNRLQERLDGKKYQPLEKMLNTFTICEKLTKIAVRAATNIGLTVGQIAWTGRQRRYLLRRQNIGLHSKHKPNRPLNHTTYIAPKYSHANTHAHTHT